MVGCVFNWLKQMHVVIGNPINKLVVHVLRAFLDVVGARRISTIQEVSRAYGVLPCHACTYGVCVDNIRPCELKEKGESATLQGLPSTPAVG